VNLRYPANRQGADLHKPETPKVARLEDVYVSLVGEQDVRFALKRASSRSTDGGPSADGRGHFVIGIVHVVVVDGSETHE
jgi:hypothetical protein